MDQRLIVVRLSEVKWSCREEDILVAYSLGSCVGLVLWDPVRKAGGMAHIFLPTAGGNSASAVSGDSWSRDKMPGKYADLAVPYLISRLEEIGCRKERLVAKVAGGAHVIAGLSSPIGDVGALNVRLVEEMLRKAGIPIIGRDVGGTYGRTMRFYVKSGRVTISSVNHGEKDL